MPTVSKLTYQGWTGYKLANEQVSLVVVPEAGGRIVSFTKQEVELLYMFSDLEDQTYDLTAIENIAAYRQSMEYLPLGGYKTWLAPQSKWDWPPYLDLAIGSYQVEKMETASEAVVSVVSPVCRESGMQLSRTFKLPTDSNQVEIEQKMKNCQPKKQKYGLWDVTQLQGTGWVIFPLKTKEQLQNLAEKAADQFINWQRINDQLYAVIDCVGGAEFKLGTYFSAGWILSVAERNDQLVSYLKTFPVFSKAEFGHGCALEVFDTYKFDYFEVEVHGPKTELASGQQTGFTENWELALWPKETEVEAIITQVANNID